MKSRDLAVRHELNPQQFDKWITQSSYRYKTGILGGVDLEDGQDFDAIVSSFRSWAQEEQARLEQAQADQNRAAQEKQQAMASILIKIGRAHV